MKLITIMNYELQITTMKFRNSNLIINLFIGLFFAILIISCGKKQNVNAVFTELSSEKTNVTFANNITEDERNNIIQYLYYYNGGGVAAGDVNNDGLPDLYFTSNQGQNKLYINKGNLRFEDETEKAARKEDFIKLGFSEEDIWK